MQISNEITRYVLACPPKVLAYLVNYKYHLVSITFEYNIF